MATLSWLLALCVVVLVSADNDDPECSHSLANSLTELDPNLKEMTYDIGNGPETTLVYVDPPVASYYQIPELQNMEVPTEVQPVRPKFNGFQGKFINLSAKPVTLYWEDRAGGTKHPMRQHKPFSSSGTATFPSHRFYFCEPNQPDAVLKFMKVGQYPENLYFYDPYFVEGDPAETERNLKVLSDAERERYDKWRLTLAFNEFYVNATGRSYLANYLRPRPRHPMWRADYFGQEHWVTTKETQFVQMPPSEELEDVPKTGTGRKLAHDQPRLLAEYRDPNKTILNMTLKVLSCSPRAFEISNFLSPTEVQHILDVAGGHKLSLSKTGDGPGSEKDDSRRTRTSFNSWVSRETSPIMDAIYRRAADLQLVDEALMRHRTSEEVPDLASKRPLTEQLQLVHYGPGQEYTAHHDFGFAHVDQAQQGARFSTLLLYLNEGMDGGETSFPRYVNGETFHKLKVKPEVGKAILFYSQLPDGNMDDFSHHAAEPIREGEKWLMNLWFWDPVYS